MSYYVYYNPESKRWDYAKCVDGIEYDTTEPDIDHAVNTVNTRNTYLLQSTEDFNKVPSDPLKPKSLYHVMLKCKRCGQYFAVYYTRYMFTEDKDIFDLDDLCRLSEYTYKIRR